LEACGGGEGLALVGVERCPSVVTSAGPAAGRDGLVDDQVRHDSAPGVTRDPELGGLHDGDGLVEDAEDRDCRCGEVKGLDRGLGGDQRCPRLKALLELLDEGVRDSRLPFGDLPGSLRLEQADGADVGVGGDDEPFDRHQELKGLRHSRSVGRGPRGRVRRRDWSITSRTQAFTADHSAEHRVMPLSAHSAQRDGPAAVPAEVPTSRWELAGRYLLSLPAPIRASRHAMAWRMCRLR